MRRTCARHRLLSDALDGWSCRSTSARGCRRPAAARSGMEVPRRCARSFHDVVRTQVRAHHSNVGKGRYDAGAPYIVGIAAVATNDWEDTKETLHRYCQIAG